MKKYIILILVVAGIFYAGYALTNKDKIDESIPRVEDPSLIEISPTSFDLGKIIMKNGIVEREYEIKNNSDKTLILKKIATSCMCTKAYVTLGDQKTRIFGMEGHGDKNPSINFEIPGGSTAKIISEFDPAAHGIAGTGVFDRIVWLTFADPIGVREVTFNGEVVLE
ncbi:MAG: DUF1573 domain-containing protein [Candidatus Woesebacteria bacterium]|nr:DUF1573 domain-containing protein [Candidatus Woesebacteria bacterium]